MRIAPLLALLVLLVAAAPAYAAVPLPPPPFAPTEVEEAIEDEEEGEWEEGEEVGSEEFEEEEEDAVGPFPPDECLLRTARARVFTSPAKSTVRLVVRYTSLAPAQVTVDYRLTGKKGALSLGQARQRFQKSGVFRLAATLSEAQMSKVRAAKSFEVSMRIPAAPSDCNRFYSRQLTIKRTVHNQIVWFQSDSIFGTGA